MQEFEDLGPEYRQGTYLGRLPRELRQLTTRYEESCNYSVIIHISSNPNIKTIGILDRRSNEGRYIPFERGIRNEITMKEFILNVKQDIETEYRVTSTYTIGGFIKNHIGLFNTGESQEIFVNVMRLCRELEEALFEMERFQNS